MLNRTGSKKDVILVGRFSYCSNQPTLTHFLSVGVSDKSRMSPGHLISNMTIVRMDVELVRQYSGKRDGNSSVLPPPTQTDAG